MAERFRVSCGDKASTDNDMKLVRLVLPTLLLAVSNVEASSYVPYSATPPKVPREFRGAWIATVGNIDWPSKPGLPVTEQRAELISLLARAAALKLNAIIFQVRPSCDAIYASKIEPWSEFLTGTMGQAPQPFYDPLTLAIEEAHRRGMELHAWFNPYRARLKAEKGPVAASHVSKTRPQIVRNYGKYLWLDPGELETQEYSLSVVMDVVRRYDVDGIHFDDYFYPYREKGADGKELDFPDGASWEKYGAKSKLSRDDWRRRNVDLFVRRVYESIKATKPTVKFGVSPFGIWRPGNPPQIRGFDAYGVLYADSKKWLQSGWVDYFTPQLYWAIEPKEQSFAALLNWWNQQNPKRRHIWPGMSTVKARERWGPDEIVKQIQLAARQPVSAGHVHWNLKSLLGNNALQTALKRSVYAQPALVPACPWLESPAPGKPNVFVTDAGGKVQIAWETPGGEVARFWLLQTRRARSWTCEVLGTTRKLLDLPAPEVIVVTPIGSAGQLGTASVLMVSN